MFGRILVANRGEIAVRIARTCRERGVEMVAVFSDVDANSRHVAVAHEKVHLPGIAPSDTYLNVDAILEAAKTTGAEAIHPGYGFLSESADFAEAVIAEGLAWIGPPPEATWTVGDKIRARRLAENAGVPIVPGTNEPALSVDVARDFASAHGYPIAVKAAGGGGGRGLKVARSADELEAAFESARREAQAYFSSSDVYIERYLDNPKHLEVQILAPNPDEAMWLGVRDCSFQRRHQKLIEETPLARFAERAVDMGQAATALSKACGYVNAGTVEMLVEEDGAFFFLEVNARLQVEHTVTEEVLGLDLVACQLQIASGDALGFSQPDIEARMHGHAIECRINAEDPAMNFVPSPGRIATYVEPNGLGVRVDSGYMTGDEIPDAYDSLLAKLITWGNDREEARARMLRALDEFVIEGVATTIPAHKLLLQNSVFATGAHTTRTLEEGALLSSLAQPKGADEDVLLAAGRPVRLWHPSMAKSAAAAVHGSAAATGDVVAPMQGTILKVLVEPGGSVAAGDGVLVLETMKMETTITAPRAGVVASVQVTPGDTVAVGQTLALIEEA